MGILSLFDNHNLLIKDFKRNVYFFLLLNKLFYPVVSSAYESFIIVSFKYFQTHFLKKIKNSSSSFLAAIWKQFLTAFLDCFSASTALDQLVVALQLLTTYDPAQLGISQGQLGIITSQSLKQYHYQDQLLDCFG